MRFDSDKAFNQLMEKGIVATMRNFPYQPGKRARIIRHGKYICTAYILARYENTEENRRKLLKISGFTSLEEWENEATKLFGSLPKYIIVVSLKPGGFCLDPKSR